VKFENAREAASFYIEVGLRPIPINGVEADGSCRCGGNKCNAGKHEKEAIAGIWKEGHDFEPGDFEPGDNIAIALGPWGGSDDWLLCLDIDGPIDVADYVCMPLPPTLEQKSPRGRHLFFTVPAYTPLGNWVRALGQIHEPGVDLWYARGKINVAPSRSAFGSYEWGEWREPAELPAAVIEQILDRRRERGLPVLDHWDRGSKRA
jgi:hypothetical protein